VQPQECLGRRPESRQDVALDAVQLEAWFHDVDPPGERAQLQQGPSRTNLEEQAACLDGKKMIDRAPSVPIRTEEVRTGGSLITRHDLLRV